MIAALRDPAPQTRSDWRRHLLEQRIRFAADPAAADAAAALGRELRLALAPLEPECLGVYWPHRSEFNAAEAVAADSFEAKPLLALPFARRTPPEMHYRLWDGAAPRSVDECGIPSSDGPEAVPDVVVVPCVGYTASGHRLGYGGGYFDRWLGAHPHVCAVGVAWFVSRLEEPAFAPQPHDVPLAFIVTEHGPV